MRLVPITISHMKRALSPREWSVYLNSLKKGYSRAQAARIAGVSDSARKRFDAARFELLNGVPPSRCTGTTGMGFLLALLRDHGPDALRAGGTRFDAEEVAS